MIEESFMDTWPVVHVNQRDFEYLFKKGLVTKQKDWPTLEKIHNVKYIGFNRYALVVYALASDEFIKRRLSLEASLAELAQKNDELIKQMNPPDALCRYLKYIPHTLDTYSESGVKRLVNKSGHSFGVSYERIDGLGVINGLTRGAGDRFCTWDELFTTATTPQGTPFGHLVSNVVVQAPTSPTPDEIDELDFL